MSRWALALARLDALRRVGVRNVVRVSFYRFLLWANLHSLQWIRASGPVENPFSLEPEFSSRREWNSSLKASERWNGRHEYFGWVKIASSEIPVWNSDPVTRRSTPSSGNKWWQIRDFGSGQADIKCVWEASRFDWAIPFAQRAKAGSDDDFDKLNAWILDWQRENPCFFGPNWMCAQETSIRLMHGLAAAVVLSPIASPTNGFRFFVRNHLRRIFFATSYARGQRNNHILSEAAALYSGGAFLMAMNDPTGEKYLKRGRKILERELPLLIARDGSFSQYSTNYHRMVIDIIGFCEVMRRRQNLPAFSAAFLEAGARAVRWLAAVCVSDGKSVPNLGGNDGARLFAMDDTDYRDFSSSLELGVYLFGGGEPTRGSVTEQYLRWFGLPIEIQAPAVAAKIAEELEFNQVFPCIRDGNAVVFLRKPIFSFRPANNDALHVDYWAGGENLLRDAGSYSYAQTLSELARYHGSAGHNVVTFDNREPMPQVSRFLYASWLHPARVRAGDSPSGGLSAAYRDSSGNYHARFVSLKGKNLTITDVLEGRFSVATLRWRLAPGTWKNFGDGVRCGTHILSVSSASTLSDMKSVPGVESLYYMQSREIPVIEIQTFGPSVIVTRYVIGS